MRAMKRTFRSRGWAWWVWRRVANRIGRRRDVPSSLTPSTGSAASGDQNVYALDIYADSDPLVLSAGARATHTRIRHKNGRGIYGTGAGIILSDLEITHIATPTGASPHAVADQENIHIFDAPGIVIRRIKLSGGMSGIKLVNCPNARVSQIAGENFFGPFPGGQLVQFDNCPGATLDGFSVVNALGNSFPEDNISVYKSAGVTVRNGLIDGNNAPNGAGVMFEESDNGLCEDVLTVHMGNGAFTASGSQDCTFVRCDTRDGHNTGQGGRAAPLSNGLSYGSTPDYVSEDGIVPPSNGTRFIDCRYSNPANPENISYDDATIAVKDISPGAVRERSPLTLAWPWQAQAPWEPEVPAIIHEGLMAGAKPGVLGSGGALPTGWQVDSGSTTASIEVISAPKIVDGVECFDLKVSGNTNPSRSIALFYFPSGGFGGVSGAAPGQVWRARFYVQQLAQEGAGHWGVTRQLGEATAAWGYIKDHADSAAIATSGNFSAAVRTLEPTLNGAGVARVHGALFLQINNAAAYASCTYRFSAKLERVS